MERNQGPWCIAIEKFTLAKTLQIYLMFSAHGNKAGPTDSSNKSIKEKHSASEGT